MLDLAGRSKGHGIMPNSLKATTISALMTDIVKGQSNLYQLATRWNYRAGESQGVAKIYSRNVANQQVPASNFAQSDFQSDMNQESIKNGPPALSANTRRYDIEVAES